MSFWNARSRKASDKGQYGKVAKGNNSFWSTSDPHASSSQDDARQEFFKPIPHLWKHGNKNNNAVDRRQ